jgi:transposase
LLGLELSDSGFDYSILSRFRDRLIEGHAEMSLLDLFLDKCKSLGMLRDRSDMRTDSTHVVASIRNMNRSELVGKTLRATLNVLSTVDPTWVAANVEASWYLKYARRFESNRQTPTKDGIIATAEDVGRDGMALLEKIWTEDAPPYTQPPGGRDLAPMLGLAILGGERCTALASFRQPSTVSGPHRLALRS